MSRYRIDLVIYGQTDIDVSENVIPEYVEGPETLIGQINATGPRKLIEAILCAAGDSVNSEEI